LKGLSSLGEQEFGLNSFGFHGSMLFGFQDPKVL